MNRYRSCNNETQEEVPTSVVTQESKTTTNSFNMRKSGMNVVFCLKTEIKNVQTIAENLTYASNKHNKKPNNSDQEEGSVQM